MLHEELYPFWMIIWAYPCMKHMASVSWMYIYIYAWKQACMNHAFMYKVSRAYTYIYGHIYIYIEYVCMCIYIRILFKLVCIPCYDHVNIYLFILAYLSNYSSRPWFVYRYIFIAIDVSRCCFFCVYIYIYHSPLPTLYYI